MSTVITIIINIRKMKNNFNQFGILVCGSGTGMSMVANKHKNIRAALCYDQKSTKLSRQHNNANVMAIGARLTKESVALKCVNTFLKTNNILFGIESHNTLHHEDFTPFKINANAYG